MGTLLVKTPDHAKLWVRGKELKKDQYFEAVLNPPAHLSMADDSDDLAILLHLVEVLINAGLSTIILPAL